MKVQMGFGAGQSRPRCCISGNPYSTDRQGDDKQLNKSQTVSTAKVQKLRLCAASLQLSARH